MTTNQKQAREQYGATGPMMPPDAPALTESGPEYFESELHYRALADRISDLVQEERGFIVVIGDPPPGPQSLSASLDQALPERRPVMVLSCEPQLSGYALVSVWRGLAAQTRAHDRQPLAPPVPLFILDDSGQLTDEQINDIYATSLAADRWVLVMLGRPDLLDRLDRPEISAARDERTVRLNFQELGPREILPSVHQGFGTGEPAGFAEDPGAAVPQSPAQHPVRKLRLRPVPNSVVAPLPSPEAPRPGSGTVRAPRRSADVPPPDDAEDTLDALLDRLERTLLGETAARPSSPASPGPSEEPADETPDRPSRPGVAELLGAREMARRQPEAAIGASKAAPAVPPQRAAPAASRPGRRSMLLPWPATAAAACLLAAGVAAAVMLYPRGDATAPAEAAVQDAAVQDAALPTPQAASSATAEPSRPVPPPATPEPDVVAPPPAAAAEPPPAVPPPSAKREAETLARIAALVTRGDELLGTGDLASARLFYERAADAGDAGAALRLGESFDPGFLAQVPIGGAKGDPDRAASWYRRARELGSAEAEILLNSLAGK